MNTVPTPLGSLRHELEHMGDNWWWFFLLGALLVVCGTAAIVFPPVLVGTTLIIPVLLGVLLLVGGIGLIVQSFWAGRWSGFLMQLLIGILYIGCGFVFIEDPLKSAAVLTLFLAVTFMVIGVFRTVGALVLQFPQWGWALLNGVITFLAGIVIYRSFPEDSLWVIGLLIGLEMLFNGWTWIMLSLALRSLKSTTPPAAPTY